MMILSTDILEIFHSSLKTEGSYNGQKFDSYLKTVVWLVLKNDKEDKFFSNKVVLYFIFKCIFGLHTTYATEEWSLTV